MIKTLALTLPGFKDKPSFDLKPQDVPNLNTNFKDLGSVLSAGFEVVIYIAGFLLLIYLLWGGFQYLMSGSNKEVVAKARARITYAFIGFIVVIISFAIMQYLKSVLSPVDVEIK